MSASIIKMLLYYWALFCLANSPSFTALYAISVRQTRVLPIRRPFNS